MIFESLLQNILMFCSGAVKQESRLIVQSNTFVFAKYEVTLIIIHLHEFHLYALLLKCFDKTKMSYQYMS